MEDYEWEMRGVEDDFHSQFAAELEVLAELEGGRGPRRSLVTCISTGSCPGPWESVRAFLRTGGSGAGEGAPERAGPCSSADCV